MNLAQVDKIAKAVLYEGYMLYPYRPSSVKNRQRWNFGVLYPQAYNQANEGADAWSLQAECVVHGTAETVMEVRVRFLQVHTRSKSAAPGAIGEGLPNDWQEARERELNVPVFSVGDTGAKLATHRFEIPVEAGQPAALLCEVELAIERVKENLFKIRLTVRNKTLMQVSQKTTRDEVLKHSMVSCHAVLGVQSGEFLSLLEPPAGFEEIASQCQNVGVWPVLVGEAGQRDTLLASPIILYDYPQIAPESVGDLFDGTEIDEILSLRILTLTDDEKREIRQSDERARLILDRTEQLPAEQFMKLHGAVRSLRPLKENEL